MANRLRESASLWIGCVVILAYWAVAPFVPTNEAAEWLRSSQVAIAVAVTLLYLPNVIEILTARVPTHAQQLILGIIVAWFGAAGNAAWLLLYRAAGYPSWMLNTLLNGFFIWLIVVGGFLHLTAPRAIDGRIPRANWISVFAVALIGAGLAWLLMMQSPDLRWIADALEPYLSRGPTGA